MSDQLVWGSQPVPYSQEAEEAVIGGILVDPDLIFTLALTLQPDDFFLLRLRYIYEAMLEINNQGKPVEYLVVIEELRGRGQLDEIGGPAYLTQCINSCPSHIYALHYAGKIFEYAQRRQMMRVSDQTRADALDLTLPIEDVIANFQQRLEASVRLPRENYLPGVDSLNAFDIYQDRLLERAQAGEQLLFPPPPEWGGLTDFIPGLFMGNFVVISGGKGSGKSSATEQWAEHFARQGVFTEYIYTEMSEEDMLNRRMARYSGLPYHLIAAGGFIPSQPNGYTPEQRERKMEAEREIATFNKRLSYHGMPDVEASRLMMHIRRSWAAGVRVFILDHFQDVQVDVGKNDNPVRAFEKLVVWLAAFAAKRKCILIVCSQENSAGSTMWTSKLLQKTELHISIKRKELAVEEAYKLDGNEYRAEPGETSAFADWMIGKARYGRRGKLRMLNHGAGFRWLDVAHVQKLKTAKPSGAAAVPPELPANYIPLDDERKDIFQ
ncbi:MAG TPA: DnaB-like helicase N-terminal domain-containing protein [Phototrophicaceae bacterium]|nr:DnaB-like helicase N-terminal domain-containing protein [Phototrophicaceae bacterium]